MRRIPAAAVVLSLVPAPSAAAEDGGRFSAVEQAVKQAMESRGVLGVSVAIIEDYEVVGALDGLSLRRWRRPG